MSPQARPYADTAPATLSPVIADIERASRQIRSAIVRRIDPFEIAGSLARVIARWRAKNHAPRKAVLARISEMLGFSVPLLDESLDALLQPFTLESLRELASLVRIRPRLVGLIAAGNVAGAGIHEITLALLAGCGLIIKSSAREPFFFTEFARTLAGEAPVLADRICVFNWSRDRGDLTDALRGGCDLTVAYGSDETMAALAGPDIVAFGSRISAAIVTRDAAESNAAEIASRLSRDVSLFEQLGCLSPHHVFVEGDEDDGLFFARELANAMGATAARLAPPSRLDIEDAAALRAVREAARWRSIAGEPVRLFEGPGLSWVVIYDRDAPLTASPGLRCVYVSTVRDASDLEARIADANGRIEAVAIATPIGRDSRFREVLSRASVSLIAAPGQMQSPPLLWRHGEGRFLDIMTGRA
jgi:hypothetical protein